ncbi:uncharacterized protein LOC142566206 [Dermacentor variabilis]|uniref:uncharacterized protein LOC142566206 n=1 Tax=Dermacentor variabilis TaxID=34621 RepID=UPI003F5B41F2
MRDGVYFSSNCNGAVSKQGVQCVSCKYLRQALLMRKSRIKFSTTKTSRAASRKLKAAIQKNRRLLTRLGNANEQILKLQKINSVIKAEVLEENIASLPPRQQEAVRQCFSACKAQRLAIQQELGA